MISLQLNSRELDELIIGLKLNMEKAVEDKHSDEGYEDILRGLAGKLVKAYNRIQSQRGS